MSHTFHPDFIKRYKTIFDKNELTIFLDYCNKPLRRSIRINTNRINNQAFEKLAQKNNWIIEPIPYITNAYFIKWKQKNKPLGKSIEYFGGLFYIQETSSMIPPLVLNPQKGDIILDMSAAPGSKTTQMATLMEMQGFVLGNDIVSSRIKALKTNINYQGIINAGISKLDGRDFGKYYYEAFDKILLDAPCSGEGTMRKNKIDWSFEVIQELSDLQKKLITSGLQALKVGGDLVYSTCTMTPEEDEYIIDYVKNTFGEAIEVVEWELKGLQSSKGLTSWQGKKLHSDCQKGQKIWPHINDTEGFFVAKFKKKAPIKVDNQFDYKPKKKLEVILKGKELKILYSQLEKTFGISKKHFSNFVIIKKDSEYQIRTKQGNSFNSSPNIQSIGIPFGEENSNTFKLDFYSGQTFGKHATKNTVNINNQQAQDFSKGLDLLLSKGQIKNCLEGQIILKLNNIVLGTSLLQKGAKLKNQVPREHIKL